MFFISNVENFFSKKSCFFFQRFLSMFFQTWLMITVQHMWFHSFLFHSLMQHEHSQTEILTGYEMNAYRRRLFSNCFDSRSNDISWTFIYKYLDKRRKNICRPKNPTNENFKNLLLIYQNSALLNKLYLSMTHAVSGFISQIWHL